MNDRSTSKEAKERIRSLARLRPGYMVLELARCWIAIAASIALAHRVDGLAWGLLAHAVAFLVVGAHICRLVLLGHEAQHRRLTASPRLNDFLGAVFLTLPFGATFPQARDKHLAHHRKLATFDDPDLRHYTAVGKDRLGPYLLFVSGAGSFVGSLGRALQGDSGSADAGEALPAKKDASALWILLAQATVFGLVCLVAPWWTYFVLFIGPFLTFGYLPVVVRQFCEHAQPVLPDEAAADRRLISYAPPLWERLFLAPFGIQYHAEHHLYPAVPYYHLARLADELRDRDDIERRGSYTGFLVDWARRLPLPAP